MKEEGTGTAEFDFIHLVRHHPGITQAQLREELKIDKGSCGAPGGSLEAKGYLIRRDNPEDKRSQLLYATKRRRAENQVSIESTFYEWLMEELDESETEHFCEMLDRLSEIEKRKPVWIFAGKGTDGQRRKRMAEGTTMCDRKESGIRTAWKKPDQMEATL